MKVSFPFLATRPEQLQQPGRWGNEAVEATIFKGADLSGEAWAQVWRSIASAVRLYGAGNVTFHFPVDDADYVGEPSLLARVEEAFARAVDLGLHGMVIHSNRIRRIDQWPGIDLEAERRRVVERLDAVRGRHAGRTWLALENMPVMDNHGKEIDPLFVFPEDFRALEGSRVGIVWDFCHYSNSLANLGEVEAGRQSVSWYPNRREAGPLEFRGLAERIVHWHFSAFKGIANPGTGATCTEGVLPGEGEVAEAVYVEAYRLMEAVGGAHHVVFEVREPDYRQRHQAARLREWGLRVLAGEAGGQP